MVGDVTYQPTIEALIGPETSEFCSVLTRLIIQEHLTALTMIKGKVVPVLN
jgi:hypothetical protein